MSSSSSELLKLTWNNYTANYHSAFSEIRENNKFSDVTIATHDGQALAHRVILSSCSPVLARILDVSCHSHPLIYLCGIPIKHITTILDFMYKGEAHVSHDSIEEFLVSAEELKVKGLTKDETGQIHFHEYCDREVRQNCKEDTDQSKSASSLSTLSKVPIRIRSPKSLNGSFEDISIKTVSDKPTLCTPHAVKDKNKWKSECDKKMESVIDSVLEQTVSDEAISPVLDEATPPKVRKVLSGQHFLADSDDGPNLNSFQEYDHFLLQSENLPLASSDEIKTEYDHDKLILTKSDEDKARFRAIVSSMITKNASNDSGLDCLVCGKQFTGMNPKTSVTSHVDHMHTDHLLHKCHLCGVIKNTSVGLTKHFKLHRIV